MHLDGLPLAIELAAARVRTMTPDQIESRLRDRFALLTTGDRTAPERHRTLEAVIAWSWELLDDDARQALARLAVLPAGFSAATAAAVLDQPSVDDVLDRLASQSLLIVTDDPFSGQVRFRMLESVREFAVARLSHGADAAWSAVYEWARGFAGARAGRVFEVEVYREVRAEHDNLVAVLRRALEREDDVEAVLVFSILSQAWFVRGAFSEFETFGEPAFAAALRVRPDDLPADALAFVMLLGAIALQFTGDRMRPARAIARLRVVRRRVPDLAAEIAALIDVVAESTDSSRVRAAIGVVQASGDPRRALVGELLLSQFAENDGDAVTATAAAERAWEIADDTGQEWFAATAASIAGQLASQTARPAEALEWIERAAAGYAAFDSEEQTRQRSWLRAGNLIGVGRYEEAEALFAELTVTRELTDDGRELASIGWLGLAELNRARGDVEAGAAHYVRAMAWFSTRGQRGSPWYLISMAGLVSAMTFDAAMPPDVIARWARRLRTRAQAFHRARPEMVDKPVLGTVLAGWSTWALTQPELCAAGLEALALAERFGARQDFPSLYLKTHGEHATEIVGPDAVARARAAASALSREAQVEHAFALLLTR